MSRLSLIVGVWRTLIMLMQWRYWDWTSIITHNVLAFLDGREWFSRNNALFCTKFNVVIWIPMWYCIDGSMESYSWLTMSSGLTWKVICTTSSGMFMLMVKSTIFQKLQIISSKKSWKIITHSQKFVVITIRDVREPCAFGRYVFSTRKGWDVGKQ